MGEETDDRLATRTLLQLGMSSCKARIFSLILSLLFCRFVALQCDQLNCSARFEGQEISLYLDECVIL